MVLASIDGVAPREAIEPASAEELASALASASARRASVVIHGGGTKLGWGRTPQPVDIGLSTKRLNALVAHEHADLTATVQAGMRLADFNRLLAKNGQWLPVESAFDMSTIGGAIATNDSGPLRHRYGTPRDLLIGVRLALADGRLIKAGGNVVKNVAGYDIGRLMSGSHGSLAAIVSATFKLMPLPGASSTVVASFDRAEALVDALTAITGSQLEASAIEVRASGPYQLLLKFESTPAALNAHVQQARALLGKVPCDVVASESEAALWREYICAPWASPGMVVRLAWLPASLGAVLAYIDDLRACVRGVEFAGRAAIGAGLLRIDADAAAHQTIVNELRARPAVFRHAIVLRTDTAVKQHLDVWGSLGDAAALGAAVKRALDPNGILNAGRGPV
jgi:glycolate oxidase FAD binding subunit